MIILDGGIGRHLEKIGAPFGQPEWSALSLIQDPDFVFRAHHDFINAGADVITTNSYAIVPFHIGRSLFEQEGKFYYIRQVILPGKQPNHIKKK